MSEPIEPISDEWISAYLDGELSADEQRGLEASIARDPNRRQLLQQLQSLRDALRELPAHRLDEGFAERVVQRISTELDKNASATHDSGRLATQPPLELVHPRSTHEPHRRGVASRRVWQRMGSLIAVVAAVGMIVIVWAVDWAPRDAQIANVPSRDRQVLPQQLPPESQWRTLNDDAPPRGPIDETSKQDADGNVRLQMERSATGIDQPGGLSPNEAGESFEFSIPQPQAAAEEPASALEDRAAPRYGVESRRGDRHEAVVTDELVASTSPVILQADVTTEQLNNLWRQLRERQWSAAEVRLNRTGPGIGLTGRAGMVLGEGSAGSPSTEFAEGPTVVPNSSQTERAIVVAASLPDVQAALAQINVRGQELDKRRAAELDVDFAKRLNLEADQPLVPKLGATPRADDPTPTKAPTTEDFAEPRPRSDRKLELEAVPGLQEAGGDIKANDLRAPLADRDALATGATLPRVVLLLKIVDSTDR